MTPSRQTAPSVGAQRPRIFCAPSYSRSAGQEAVDLASLAGLELDQWQREHLAAALGEDAQGRWAALEVGLIVPRQNGKNGELEARQLAGLFLLEEKLQIHSAHMADTSVEQFLRLENLIEGTPELSRRTRKIARGKGNEEILLHRHPKTGLAPRLRFRPRTGSGGRGFSSDTLYLDEAMILPEAFHGTLFPVLSARPNPQIWYTGSAGDREDLSHDAVVLARLRERALINGEGLVLSEWSLDWANPEQVPPEVASDPSSWAQANPAFGVRITPEFITGEFRSMGRRQFSVERLGVGDWPDTDADAGRPIRPSDWDDCADVHSCVDDTIVLAYDVSPDRSRACVSIAGRRADGKPHIEVLEHKRGTAWVCDLIEVVVNKEEPIALVADVSGQAGALIPEIERREILGLTPVNSSEHAQACGMIFDAVDQRELRHLGTEELRDAIRGAAKRPLSDRWAWSRKDSTVDITPLVSVTLALWALNVFEHAPAEAVDLNEIMQEMREDGEDLTEDLYDDDDDDEESE